MLVVHGDAAARALIVDALRMEGFRAVAGSHRDAQSALVALGAEIPRVVLLDLDDEVAVGAFLAALELRHRSVPIIGLSTTPRLRDGSAVGAAELLAEPFELDHLFEIVARFCGAN